MTKFIYDLLKTEVLIPLNSRIEVHQDTLDNLADIPENDTLKFYFSNSKEDMKKIRANIEEVFARYEGEVE